MTDTSHRSDARILQRRTLEHDHRRLKQFVEPGMSVLDVGCGTGAITAGIARVVGRSGRVVGVDRDAPLLQQARLQHGNVPHLEFLQADATALPFAGEFDVVTAARTLQWVPDSGTAVACMRDALRPGGTLVVLDYNHARNRWNPLPPRAFLHFYESFLAWRESLGLDNEIADHLPEQFAAARLQDVRSSCEDEVTRRGDSDFEQRTSLWSEVIETLRTRLADAGFCTEEESREALDSYGPWVREELAEQTLELRVIVGRR